MRATSSKPHESKDCARLWVLATDLGRERVEVVERNVCIAIISSKLPLTSARDLTTMPGDVAGDVGDLLPRLRGTRNEPPAVTPKLTFSMASVVSSSGSMWRGGELCIHAIGEVRTATANTGGCHLPPPLSEIATNRRGSL